MPSINEIAVKMTADTTEAVHGFMQVDKEIKKLMRVQKALQDAGMGDGEQAAGITKMIGELRKLQGQFDTSAGSANAYKDAMASLAPGMEKSVRTTEGLIARMKNYDVSIKAVQTQLNALNAAGIKDTNGQLAKQIVNLQSAKQSMITYSGATMMTAKEMQVLTHGIQETTVALTPLQAAAERARTILSSMGGGNTVSKLRALDSQILRLQGDLRYMASNGLRPATTAIHQQIAALQKQRASVIAASGTVRELAAAERELNNSMMMTARGSGRMQVAMTQVSFGVEDFMTQLGPMGLSGALRAAGNNMSMVAHSLGSWKWGAAVGVGMAVLPMLINMLGKTEEATEKVKNTVDELIESTTKLADLRKKTVLQEIEDPVDRKKHQRELEDLENSQKTADDMQKVRDDAIKSEREHQDELVEVQKEGNRRVQKFKDDLVSQGMSREDAEVVGDAAVNTKGMEESLDDILKRQREELKKRKEDLNDMQNSISFAGIGDETGASYSDNSDTIRRMNAKKKELAILEERHKKTIEIRKENKGATADIEAALERQKKLEREIEQSKQKQALAEEEMARRKQLETDRQVAKDAELAKLKEEETGAQDELKELGKAAQVVSGAYSAQVNTGAAVAAAVADKFNTDKDIKREELNETLKQIRDEQKQVTKIKVVGNY